MKVPGTFFGPELVPSLDDYRWYAIRVVAVNTLNIYSQPSELIYYLVSPTPSFPQAVNKLWRTTSNETSVGLQWVPVGRGELGGSSQLFGTKKWWGFRIYVNDEFNATQRLVCDFYGRGNDRTSCTTPWDQPFVCGRIYNFWVGLSSIVGDSILPEVPHLTMKLTVPPSEPRNLRVVSTNMTNIRIAWDMPLQTGCEKINQYRILRLPHGHASNNPDFLVIAKTITASQCTDPKQVCPPQMYDDNGSCGDSNACTCSNGAGHCLIPGGRYQYRLQARGFQLDDTGGAFDGPPGYSVSSNTITTYAGRPPSKLGSPPQWKFSNSTTIIIEWSAIVVDNILNFMPVKYYILYLAAGVAEPFYLYANVTETTVIVGNLKLGTKYRFRVHGVNELGVGEASDDAFLMTADVPEPPHKAVVTTPGILNTFRKYPVETATATVKDIKIGFSAVYDGTIHAFIVDKVTARVVDLEPLIKSDLRGTSETYGLGGAFCKVLYQPVQADVNGDIHLGRTLTADGCLLQYGQGYFVYLYLTNDIVDLSLGTQPPPNPKGTVSSVQVTVLPGRSNAFSLKPRLSGDMTVAGASLEFQALQNGYAWAAMYPSYAVIDVAAVRSPDVSTVMGSSSCRFNRKLITTQLNSWPFADCALALRQEYKIYLYISGIGGHDDGILEEIVGQAKQVSNSFLNLPALVGIPTGFGATVEFTPMNSGFVWLQAVAYPNVLSAQNIKFQSTDTAYFFSGSSYTYIGFGDPEQCAVFNVGVIAGVRAVVVLKNCQFFSGPLYYVYAYLETPYHEIPNPDTAEIQSHNGTIGKGQMGETCKSPTHPNPIRMGHDGNSYDAHPHVWGTMRTHFIFKVAWKNTKLGVLIQSLV